MGAETALGQLADLGPQMENAWQKVTDTVDQIIQNVTSLLQNVPPFLQDLANQIGSWVQQALETLKNLVNALWEHVILPFLKLIASPVILLVTGFAWDDNVNSPASNLAGDIQTGKPGMIGEAWTGPANQAYQAVSADQLGAAQKVASMTSTMATTLITAGIGEGIFYIALIAILLVALALLIPASGLCLGIVTIPAGVAAAIATFVTTNLSLWAWIGTVTAFATLMFTDLNNLDQMANDNTAFPGGHWPGWNQSGPPGQAPTSGQQQAAHDIGLLGDPGAFQPMPGT